MGDTPRKVSQIIKPDYVMEGAGVLLQRSFGPSRANPFDPFLLFDHFAFNDPIEGPIVGFPMHPHRGIETVTYMLSGEVEHSDSLGNEGVIGAGDVQWMTAGSGIIHQEMPQRVEDRLRGFQLWANLPASLKMTSPRYQDIKAAEIPEVIDDDGTPGVQFFDGRGDFGSEGQLTGQGLLDIENAVDKAPAAVTLAELVEQLLEKLEVLVLLIAVE